MKNEPARRRLARIRCLMETIKRMETKSSLPSALCFVAGEVEYTVNSDLQTPPPIPILKKPSKNSEKIGEIFPSPSLQVFASGEEFCSNQGAWLKLTQKSLQKFCTPANSSTPSKTLKEGWVLQLTYDPKQGAGKPILLPVSETEAGKGKKKADNVETSSVKNWSEAVEMFYTLRLSKPPAIEKYGDREAMRQLTNPPPKWSLEADEELAKFLADHMNKMDANLGSISHYVDGIEVSSEDSSKDCLTDGDPVTYWESDGNQGRHWVRLSIKPGVIIKRLYIELDARDDNYMPYRIIISGGEVGHFKQLNEVFVDLTVTGDVLVLEEMTQYFHIIEIKIKECKGSCFSDDGIDTRIHGIKIVSTGDKEPGLSRDLFADTNLVRFPKLDAVDTILLYHRAKALLRFVELLDSVIHYLLPSWNYTAGSFKDLEAIRQLLPLSRYRGNLIEKFLKESQTCSPEKMPKLFINRRLAAEHRADPSQDPDAKYSMFHQLYEGLHPEKCGVKLDFRWSGRYDQWWECKFLSEGIIDQGGGFRDSLADMAEELCPSSMDDPMPLNYFVRSPNQLHDSSNVNRDTYLPNPSCKELAKFEWIGMVMGGCLRSGREHLVLSLASYTWKQLVGERVSWSRDFQSVDFAQVKLLETLESMDRETFDTKFSGVLTFTAVLSDNTLISLAPGGAERYVDFEERKEYCRLVQEARMFESKLQVEAIRRGMLKVVPRAVLDLITWQELEKKVCGDPEITVEALKKSSHYEDISENDRRIKDLWNALENFTNEDRSRFLRFVTGRRRLPAQLYICPGRSNAETDSLPEAATCSSTLFLPKYSSAKVAEEKIRYASYNCIAIDTDVSPWEE
ncbi:E3 ubiquitin-protein ligase HECTD3-like isoform X2 [Nematostella vectensis]|uniref:E3 ubiquitin-protein ligase HECTD3-like isoform X2 n=1 Tax=Nematostella vectensis TaxID=45351 RepID=UPI0020775FBC|nr:E3 ubiquitin-protein ligase HECTD3-like isoform X2 [Nematostella vectensis]